MTRCNAYGGGTGNVWCGRELGHKGRHKAFDEPGFSVGLGWQCDWPQDEDRLNEKFLFWCVDSLWKTFWRLGGW